MAVQTQIQTRRGTAATWTSTNPTLAAGEIGFETDTGKIKIGNGSTAWASLAYTASATATTYTYTATAGQTTFSGADGNGLTLAYTVGSEQVYLNGVLLVRGTDYTASDGTSVVLASGAIVSDILNVVAFAAFTVSDNIAKSTLSAKGSLIAASAAGTPANLAVGADGSTLVANSAASTGLSWALSPAFAAGKNKIINGDFRVNQRNLTTTSTDGAYGFDRFYWSGIDGTNSYSAQTFTAGAAPVAGYESINFARLVCSGQTLASAQTTLRQKIEDVRTFAGQPVTVSFWAKAATGTPSVAVELTQNFGSGGRSAVTGNIATKQAITTSWARYSWTGTLPSVSGKTIGTSSFIDATIWVSAGTNFNARTGSLGIQSNTFDIWGVQVEAGSIATPFQTASGGSIQGELAMCQRYYIRTTSTGTDSNHGIGLSNSTTNAYIQVNIAEMRVIPTSVDYANLNVSDSVNNYSFTGLSINTANSTPRLAFLIATGATGMTQFRPIFMRNNNNTAGYLGLSAEL